MPCSDSKWSYFGGLAFVASIFLLLAAFFFKFLKGWKGQNARVISLSHKVYMRMCAAFIASLLRNLIYIAALTATHHLNKCETVRLLLFSAMVCHLFAWLCCFDIWVIRLRLAFNDTIFAVTSRLLLVYRVSAVFVALFLFTSGSLHFATCNRPLEQLSLHVITTLAFVAMVVLQTHLCSKFVSPLIELVATTVNRRVPQSTREMTAPPSSLILAATTESAALKTTYDSSEDESKHCSEESSVETKDSANATGSQTQKQQILVPARSRRSTILDFEQSERELLLVATKLSVTVSAAIACELFAMAGFLVLSEAGANSLCGTLLNYFAMIALVAGVNGVVFCVYLSFNHSKADYNALCSKCDYGCGKMATYFVNKYSEERSLVVQRTDIG